MCRQNLISMILRGDRAGFPQVAQFTQPSPISDTDQAYCSSLKKKQELLTDFSREHVFMELFLVLIVISTCSKYVEFSMHFLKYSILLEKYSTDTRNF